ncbi:homoserine kinase [Sporosarcina sp. 179-K 8C2 HS]|uniref:homoserine kinase n=1 Tax=Sporosarcina sp. 179-K 8C2 HS TaxID=3142387 RepID=UPI00399F97C8
MEEPLFTIVVPATTANLGPGYDSVGMALSLYMTVSVTPADTWSVQYEGDEYAKLTTGSDNLIVRTVQEVAERFGKEAAPHSLKVSSDIPLGKGLGSSATAIAAGIVIADTLLGLDLQPVEKARIGSELEGHSDNVTAALLGGITVTYFTQGELEIIHLPSPAIGAVVLVPPKALGTEESRGLLPKELPHSEAVAGSAASSMMTTAMAIGDWELAGRMMEKDVFHEPYRKKLFPEIEGIRAYCHEIGAYGMTISGAGPSLFVAVKEGTEEEVAEKLKRKFPYYDGFALQPAESGAKIQ